MNLFSEILAAQERLRGHAHLTPVMTSRTLDGIASARVFLKCENLQRAGAFKFRGAFNALSKLAPEQRKQGVITYSSGNHAQAIALVGQILGIPTTVVMPSDAPRSKRAATAGYGASVIEYDPATATRESVAAKFQAERGLVLIPPFDHLDVIAGQGTAAAELIEQTGGLEAILVPCGGGGLLSGTAIATKHLCPSCQVAGVEPAAADDATRSFHSKNLQSVMHPDTIADGTRTASLGQLTFPLVLKHVDQMCTVSEDAIREAVRFLFFRMKLVVEPSGALGVAALLSGSGNFRGRTGVILSGGNIDAGLMRDILDA